MPLRDYQQEALDALENYIAIEDGNPLVVMPTGSGKSHVIADFVLHMNEQKKQKTLIVSHVKEILFQNYEKLQDAWPYGDIGLYGNSLKSRDTDNDIIYAQLQSVWNKVDELPLFDLLTIDEAHLVPKDGEGMYRSLIVALKERNPNLKVIGFTATPYRLNSGMLTEGDGSIFDDVAIDFGSGENFIRLIDDGYLSPLITKCMDTEYQLEDVGLRGGEFIQTDLQAKMNDSGRTNKAMQEVLTKGANRKQWLIFCAGINHARMVSSILNVNHITSRVVTGDTNQNERDQLISDYKSGKIKALVNCDVLTTGFDAPNTDMIVMLRPTHSPGLYVQMMGRGMRIAEGKKDCLILDFAKNIERHGPINQIAPNQKGQRKKTGEALVKSCPECKSYVPKASTTCPDCGYIYPMRKLELDLVSSQLDIIAKTARKERYDTKVLSMWFGHHQKAGKPTPVLKVSYKTPNKIISEYVCFEHSGYARDKAVVWWNKMISGESLRKSPPKTVDEAMFRQLEVNQPDLIKVDYSGKFPNIVNHIYANR
jgi:DNA repair protein RadD